MWTPDLYHSICNTLYMRHRVLDKLMLWDIAVGRLTGLHQQFPEMYDAAQSLRQRSHTNIGVSTFDVCYVVQPCLAFLIWRCTELGGVCAYTDGCLSVLGTF